VTARPGRSGTLDRRWLVAGLVALVLAGAVVVGFLWRRPPAPEPPRAREYADVNVCLLTAEQGLADPDAMPVWAGMQQASPAAQVRVQYVAITGPQAVDNARAFLAGLVQSKCTMVLAASGLPLAAVKESAPSFPDTQFVTVGGSPTANVATITAGPPQPFQEAVVRSGISSSVVLLGSGSQR
jgi:basic membrane lipoprotein Med (substrate-binding protein (PBP1-ABC) superfamily)